MASLHQDVGEWVGGRDGEPWRIHWLLVIEQSRKSWKTYRTYSKNRPRTLMLQRCHMNLFDILCSLTM